MLLGALMHAGASLEEMRAELARLPLTGYTLEAQRVTKAGIAAVQAEVRVRERQEPRVLTDVTELIDGSSLPAADRDKGRAGFHRLAGGGAGGGGEGELVTPTGAAIVTTLARFERPEMTLERTGYGAGSRDLPDRPNVLRLWLGEALRQAQGTATRPMVLIETNIDDMTGEMLGYVLEKLLAQGAADAWLTPVQMKKNRPGVVLSVICGEPEEEALARLILRETSTLRVRVRLVHRWEAEREALAFESSLGPAAVKVKRLPDEPPRVAPEYEACRRLAETSGLPLAEVYRIVQAEGEARLGSRE